MKAFEGRVAVLSNSVGASEFDPNFSKADAFEANTGIKVIRHRSKVMQKNLINCAHN